MKAFFVTERLAFGTAATRLEHVQRLRGQGVTHAINLRWHRSEFLELFPSLWLAYRDDLKPRPIEFYSRALSFYRNAMEFVESKIFVMCHHGYRRSPALVYFLLRSDGISPERARKLVTRARRSVHVATSYRASAERFLAIKDIRIFGSKRSAGESQSDPCSTHLSSRMKD